MQSWLRFQWCFTEYHQSYENLQSRIVHQPLRFLRLAAECTLSILWGGKKHLVMYHTIQFNSFRLFPDRATNLFL